jgi:hypothetical protein
VITDLVLGTPAVITAMATLTCECQRRLDATAGITNKLESSPPHRLTFSSALCSWIKGQIVSPEAIFRVGTTKTRPGGVHMA